MCSLFILLVLANILVTQSIFVTPNKIRCPTNKIAPQRRIVAESRTLGYFYDLLVDDVGDRPYRPETDFNCDEESQNDDNNDTQNDDDSANDTAGGKFYPTDRLFGNWFGSNHQKPPRPQQPTYGQGSGDTQQPARPPYRPPTRPPAAYPTRPPTRPPYHSGGLLVNRPHVPPRPEYPSDTVKPVYEQIDDRPAAPWIPGIVGGPSGDVVGARPAFNRYQNTHYQDNRYQGNRYQDNRYQDNRYQDNRTPRRFNDGGNSILGSFVDLFFK